MRTTESTCNFDLSPSITSFLDLYRVLEVEESLRWNKHAKLYQSVFHLTESEWKSLVDRLVVALQSGLDGLDATRLSKMTAEGNKESLVEKMVETVPKDIMFLYQIAWKLLVSPSWLPAADLFPFSGQALAAPMYHWLSHHVC